MLPEDCHTAALDADSRAFTQTEHSCWSASWHGCVPTSPIYSPKQPLQACCGSTCAVTASMVPLQRRWDPTLSASARCSTSTLVATAWAQQALRSWHPTLSASQHCNTQIFGTSGRVQQAPCCCRPTSLISLKRINLQKNFMDAADTGALAPYLARLMSLKYLAFGGNDLGARGADLLAPCLARLSGLQQISLGSNEMGAADIEPLAPVLARLTTLQHVTLWSRATARRLTLRWCNRGAPCGMFAGGSAEGVQVGPEHEVVPLAEGDAQPPQRALDPRPLGDMPAVSSEAPQKEKEGLAAHAWRCIGDHRTRPRGW